MKLIFILASFLCMASTLTQLSFADTSPHSAKTSKKGSVDEEAVNSAEVNTLMENANDPYPDLEG